MKNIIKTIIFLSICVALFLSFSHICKPEEQRNQQKLYDNQAKDSISIAFVGNSSTHQFYDTLEIWKTYGITSMIYSNNALPTDFTTHLTDLALKNQSPELVVIDLRGYLSDEHTATQRGTYLTDSIKTAFSSALNILPLSYLKTNAVISSEMFANEEYTYALNFIKQNANFSDNLTEFRKNGFKDTSILYQGNDTLSVRSKDMTASYYDFKDETPLPYTMSEGTIKRFEELFEYIEENELNVYFTFTPYINKRGMFDLPVRTAFDEYLTDNGYMFTDFKVLIEDIGLDMTTDYYDVSHTNALGANKYTLYALEKILSEVDITPNYSDEVIETWDNALNEWTIFKEEQVDILFSAN